MRSTRAGAALGGGDRKNVVDDGSVTTLPEAAVEVADKNCPDCRRGRGWALRFGCGAEVGVPDGRAAVDLAQRVRRLFPDEPVELHVPGCAQ